MYLKPLNYDPFFKKVFSDLHIAQRFLEDFFDITIETIELLPIDHKATDNSAYVAFDFRCKINNAYVIIDMQQWYKSDVIKRFYVYHALSTVLQLEQFSDRQNTNQPKKTEQLPNFNAKYNQIIPVITLIWFVHETLGFTEDFVSYSTYPDALSNFIDNNEIWQTDNFEKLLEERKKCLSILNNNTKNLQFMSENKLIYAFQKNIVKNKKYEKYYQWFEFAELCLDKNNQLADFEKYQKDEVFMEIMRRLNTNTATDDDFEKIDLYQEIAEAKEEARQEARQEVLQAEKKAEQAEKKAEQAEKKAEQAEKKAEQALQAKLLSAKAMKDDGVPINLIAQYLNLSADVIENL